MASAAAAAFLPAPPATTGCAWHGAAAADGRGDARWGRGATSSPPGVATPPSRRCARRAPRPATPAGTPPHPHAHPSHPPSLVPSLPAPRPRRRATPTALLGDMAHTLPQFVSGLAVSLGFGLVGVVGTTVNGDLLRRVAAGHAEERGLLPPGASASGGAAATAEAAVRARLGGGRGGARRLPPPEGEASLVDGRPAAAGSLIAAAADGGDGGDGDGDGVGHRRDADGRLVRRGAVGLVVEEPGGWQPPPPASDYGDGGDWARELGGEGGGGGRRHGRDARAGRRVAATTAAGGCGSFLLEGGGRGEAGEVEGGWPPARVPWGGGGRDAAVGGRSRRVPRREDPSGVAGTAGRAGGRVDEGGDPPVSPTVVSAGGQGGAAGGWPAS